MLKLSANLSMLFTELPWQARIDAAARAGFAAVEIQFPYDWERARLKQQLAQAGLPLVLINLPAGDLMQGGAGLAAVPERRRDYRAALSEARRWAEDLHVPCVNVLAGRSLPQHPPQAQWDCLVENLRLTCRSLSELGISTCVEAINIYDMPGFLMHQVSQLQDLIAEVGEDSLKMQIDIYHLLRMGGEIASTLRENIAHLGHLQFADLPGRGAPGSGKIDWPAFFALIEELPYHGYCGAEYRVNGDTFASLTALQKHLRPRH